MTRGRVRRQIARAWLLALIPALLLLAGCATGDRSEMPWNTPQPWEGNPAIPGMPNR